MKKIFTFCFAVAAMMFATASAQDVVSASTTVEAADNTKALLTIEVGDATDLTKIPVSVMLTNPDLEITAVEGCLQLPVDMDKFVYDEDEEDYVYDGTDRWLKTHSMFKNAGTVAHGSDWFYFSITNSSSKSFKGTSGAVVTFYFDGSSLSDGKYEVSFKDALAIWTDKVDITSYKSADSKASFTISGGKATGIEGVEAESTVADGAIYTISGQQVSAPVKGQVYIVNGKKIKY